MRVGLGVDHHRLVESEVNSAGMKLTLGGYVFEDAGLALEGNSDGDVIIHALCNALSTAIGGGSLGPVTDKMCLEDGIKESRFYLQYFLDQVTKAGYVIVNVSISVEAGKPRLEKFRELIVSSLAEIMNIKVEQIGLAFTSGDGLSAYANGEGICAQVIVLIQEINS